MKKSKNIGIGLLSICKRGVNKIIYFDYQFIHPFSIDKEMNKILHHKFRFINLSFAGRGVKKSKIRYLIIKDL